MRYVAFLVAAAATGVFLGGMVVNFVEGSPAVGTGFALLAAVAVYIGLEAGLAMARSDDEREREVELDWNGS